VPTSPRTGDSTDLFIEYGNKRKEDAHLRFIYLLIDLPRLFYPGMEMQVNNQNCHLYQKLLNCR
jgi:hypothetical protein